MKPPSFMLIAGETSGDLLGAELVDALRTGCLRREEEPTDATQPLHTPLAPEFFGAGGPRLAAVGVELAEDMTRHSVIGLWEAVRRLAHFRRVFKKLMALALERQPDVIICVDFAGFNRRFAGAIRRIVRRQRGGFNNWRPKLVQFVSPQVWASRPTRALSLAADLDLLLVTFPFERDWYAQKFPSLPVKFVGNPALERHQDVPRVTRMLDPLKPNIVLLPGSRPGEIRHHVPVVGGAARLIREAKPGARFTMVLPNEDLKRQADGYPGLPDGVRVLAGSLAEALCEADLAITKSGTITQECALFGVPAVVFYKTSWPTYFAARTLVQVPYVAMPNLLAGRAIYPELLQHRATPENIARQALAMLEDRTGLAATRLELLSLVGPLQKRGASRRAAQAILQLLA